MSGLRLRNLALSLLCVANWSFVRGTLVTSPADLADTVYDFIIVGAGTSGNVVAQRLANATFKVLLIEAGYDNEVIVEDQVPFLSGTMAEDSIITWNDTTTAQTGLDDRSVSYPRGYVLGGTSTINHLVWTRGSVDDYDRYANYTGDDGWSWDNLYSYMLESETLVAPADGHNTTGEIDPSVHGTSGPVAISLPGYPTAIDDFVFQTADELSDEFPYNIDVNSGYPLGTGWLQSAITTDGRRVSSATSYLDPVFNSTNLDIIINTQVTQLISSGTVDGSVAFNKVEVATSATGARYTIEADKEIILSAGAIGTAQLLLLSGIGDSATLQALNITPTLDLPEVGQNLRDHPQLYANWFVNSTDTFDPIWRNSTLEDEMFEQWEAEGTGLFVDNGVSEIIFSRISDEAFEEAGYTDPSAGPASPHIEFIPGNMYLGSTPSTGNYLGMVIYVVSPTAVGNITLQSNNAFDLPIVNPNLLGSDFDAWAMVQGLRMTQAFLNASAWNGWVLNGTVDALNPDGTDADLEAYARENTGSGFHPSGTARMESTSGDDGVVTSELLVKGASGLRVVDASVLPFLPSSHLQACLYAIAERASDLIIEMWSS